MLFVGHTKLKGRGIFTQKPFVKGDIIEISPVILIPAEEVELIDKTVLGNYYHNWENQGAALPLGLISLSNHSYHPNAYYVKKFAEGEVELIAYRDIEAGEEITVNYNGSPDNQSPIWFDTVEEISTIRVTNNDGVS